MSPYLQKQNLELSAQIVELKTLLSSAIVLIRDGGISDYDPNYKPEFPEIVHKLNEHRKRIESAVKGESLSELLKPTIELLETLNYRAMDSMNPFRVDVRKELARLQSITKGEA
jgi:hypothetical protein